MKFNSCILGAALILSGCSQVPDSAPAVASCLVESMNETDQYNAGTMLAKGAQIPISRIALVSCDSWASALGLNLEYRKGMQVSLTNYLMETEMGRKGLYSQIAGPGIPLKVQWTLGDVGSFFDRGHRAAMQALSCKSMSQEAISFIQQLETPMATAVIGYNINMPEPSMAMSMATMMLDTVDKATKGSKEAYAHIDCAKDDGKQKFKQYAQELQLFAEGKHPWAPGCGVTSDDLGMKLKCVGA